MAQEILVALKSEDRLSQMIPYIEKIAKPGMRVILLIRFIPQSASKTSRPEESGYLEGKLEKPKFTRENVWGRHSIEKQRLSAEHKVFLALEALRERGIEIIVDIYTGSLRRAMKSYTSKGDVHSIVMRAKGELMMDLLRKVFSVFGLNKQPTFSPILILHSSHAV